MVKLFGSKPKGEGTPAQNASAEPNNEQQAATPDSDALAAELSKGVLACAEFLQTDVCKGKEVAAADLLAEGMTIEQAKVSLKHIPAVSQSDDTSNESEANNMGDQFKAQLESVDTQVGGNDPKADDEEDFSDFLANEMKKDMKGEN